FGVGLRPAREGVQDAPFPVWAYRPPYLPNPLAIQMGSDSEVVTEPLLFFLTFGRRPDSYEATRRQPLEHEAGFGASARGRVCSLRGGPVSAAFRAVGSDCPLLSFGSGDQHLVEMGFDEETEEQSADLRPILPLILRW